MASGQITVTIVGNPCADLQLWLTVSILINVVLIIMLIIILLGRRKGN